MTMRLYIALLTLFCTLFSFGQNTSSTFEIKNGEFYLNNKEIDFFLFLSLSYCQDSFIFVVTVDNTGIIVGSAMAAFAVITFIIM